MMAKKQQPLSAYDLQADKTPIAKHVFTIIVDNEPGVLARVIGLFSGRGYNISSLTVNTVDEEERLSRITIVASGSSKIIQQIKAQLGRLVPVRDVHDLSLEGAIVEREIVLVKLRAQGDQRVESLRIADIFKARVCDTNVDSFTFSLSGSSERIDAFVALMRA
ncbi:MAG: acetolactate synthase small subunit, partial [Pseudomonadota bacterium]